MPCNNITESIRIEIDSEDRLKDYRLCKVSCGGETGDGSLLVNHLRQRSITEILNLDPGLFSEDKFGHNRIDKFLCMKHLFAVKMALETLIGKNNGGPRADCRIIEINYDSEGLSLEAEIAVSIVTEKIRACGVCGPACATKIKNNVPAGDLT